LLASNTGMGKKFVVFIKHCKVSVSSSWNSLVICARSDWLECRGNLGDCFPLADALAPIVLNNFDADSDTLCWAISVWDRCIGVWGRWSSLASILGHWVYDVSVSEKIWSKKLLQDGTQELRDHIAPKLHNIAQYCEPRECAQPGKECGARRLDLWKQVLTQWISCQRLAWCGVSGTQVITIGLRQQPSLSKGTQHIGITLRVDKSGELKSYSGSCKARSYTRSKLASPLLFMVGIYTKRCGYTVWFV